MLLYCSLHPSLAVVMTVCVCVRLLMSTDCELSCRLKKESLLLNIALTHLVVHIWQLHFNVYVCDVGQCNLIDYLHVECDC